MIARMPGTNRVEFLWLAVAVVLAGLLGCTEKRPLAPAIDPYEEAIKSAREYQGPIHTVAKQYYEQGLERYRAGDWGQAATLFGQAAEAGVVNFPMRAEAMIYQAEALRKAKRLVESAQAARAAIRDYPDRWEPHVILAEYFVWRDNNEGAQQELDAAMRLAPDRPEVLKSLARVQLNRGLLLPALESARRARELSPNDADAKALLATVQTAQARIWEREGSFDAALTALFFAQTLAPTNPEPPLLIGRLLLEMGLPKAARRHTEAGRLLLADPGQPPREVFAIEAVGVDEDAGEYLRMADFYEKRQQADAAASQLEQALAVNCRLTEAWLRLGLLRARETSDPTGARQCLHALWILAPGSAGAKELETALKLQDEAAQDPSPGFVARAQLGSAYNDRTRTVSGENTVFAAGGRVYFTLVLRNAVGRHVVRWQVTDPNGKSEAEQVWDMEFFGRDLALVASGAWSLPGKYRSVWTMDDAVRSQLTFDLKPPGGR
jgi:tetratricopeptide (TPR) repeat protein